MTPSDLDFIKHCETRGHYHSIQSKYSQTEHMRLRYSTAY